MINTIINFIKSLFIKDKEEPTMEALHNISIPRDDPFVFPYSGIDLTEENEEMSKFDEIIEVVLEHEGGYVNDPKDPGGETNFGIAKRSNPDVDIKNLTKAEASLIYKTKYWDKNKVDDVPDDLKHIFFDMCVNQGRGTAVRVLQRAINGKGGKISVDGGFGPGTKAALAKHTPELDRVRCYRLKHYYDLVNKKPEQEKFLFGWYRRALEV
jgi:lysozyme family protein